MRTNKAWKTVWKVVRRQCHSQKERARCKLGHWVTDCCREWEAEIPVKLSFFVRVSDIESLTLYLIRLSRCPLCLDSPAEICQPNSSHFLSHSDWDPHVETEKAVGTKQSVWSWRLWHADEKSRFLAKGNLLPYVTQIGSLKLKYASYVNSMALECMRVLSNKIPNWPKWSSFLRALLQG